LSSTAWYSVCSSRTKQTGTTDGVEPSDVARCPTRARATRRRKPASIRSMAKVIMPLFPHDAARRSTGFLIVLTFYDFWFYIFCDTMTVRDWVTARSVELGASLCTAGVLIGGLAIGVPFLRDRIPEVFFYSFCCVSAVLLRASLDLAVRGAALAVRSIRTVRAPAPVASQLEPSRA
jgi:hypothetical protein